jgi:ABC-type transport system involved in cytochrome c biogenesis permease subunit
MIMSMIMVMIVAMSMVLVIVIMVVPVVVAAVRTMDMALRGLFLSQKGGAAFTDIGISLRGELVDAGQDAKAHGF